MRKINKISRMSVVAIGIILLSLSTGAIAGSSSQSATISVNPAITYQRMGLPVGPGGERYGVWEAVAGAGETNRPAYPAYIDEVLNRALDEVGIDRLRVEIQSGVENSVDFWSRYDAAGRPTGKSPEYLAWRAARYSTVNDNNDPFLLEPRDPSDPTPSEFKGFYFNQLDNKIDHVVLPLKEKLAAQGKALYINLNYVAFNGQITNPAYDYHHSRNAEEYAEFVLATYLHMRNKYGLVPDSWEIFLEPENTGTGNPSGYTWPKWTPQYIAQCIVATAKRLKAYGFVPRFSVPSTTDAGNAPGWLTTIENTLTSLIQGETPAIQAEIRNSVIEASYHLYGGNNASTLQNIAATASRYGLQTAMLEWWSDNNTYDTLHQNIKLGLNSAWQRGVLGGQGTVEDNSAKLFVINITDPKNPKVITNSGTKPFSQYSFFIHGGALRIAAVSKDANFDPIAFINPDGTYVVVVKATNGGQFSIGGLASGTYGIRYTTSQEYGKMLADYTIGQGGVLSTAIPMAGVLTLYQKAASGTNKPPVVQDQSVTLQEDTLSQIVPLAKDPDGDKLSFTIVSPANYGTVVYDTQSGVFKYQPQVNSNGKDTFSYKANDGRVDSNIAVVSITVTPVNDAPAAYNQRTSTNEDISEVIVLNATDADGDTLTYSIVNQSSHGSLSGNAANVTYTPASGYSGPDSFTFKANDGKVDSNVATVSVSVIPVGHVPAAPTNLTASAISSTQVYLKWQDNADNENGFKIERGLDGQAFTVIATIETNLYVNKPVMTYSDKGLAAGKTYYYRVKAYNDTGSSTPSNTAQVTTSGNHAPMANGQQVVVTQNTAQAITLNATDTDKDTLSYTVVANPGHGTLSGNTPNLIYTPTANYSGPDMFTFKANDGKVDSNVATVSIAVKTVIQVPAAPSNLIQVEKFSLGTPVNQAFLRWVDNSSNETGFKIERSVGNQTAFVQIEKTAADVFTFTDNNLSGVTYYRVCAYNNAGNSPYSNILTVTISNDLPKITRIWPISDNPGALIYIPGDNFGSYQAGCRVEFSTTTATINAKIIRYWSNRFIMVVVPESNPGMYKVKVVNARGASNQVDFTITTPSASRIYSIFPAQGTAGTVVTISGQGFGIRDNYSQVGIAMPAESVFARITSWTNTSITFIVPALTHKNETYWVSVITKGETSSNKVSFKYY